MANLESLSKQVEKLAEKPSYEDDRIWKLERDKSEFTEPCPLSENEKNMEEIWNQQHSLNEIIDEKNFKNYAELEARFNTVIAHEGKEFVGTIEESTDDPVATGEKADETLDYFKKLAEQD